MRRRSIGPRLIALVIIVGSVALCGCSGSDGGSEIPPVVDVSFTEPPPAPDGDGGVLDGGTDAGITILPAPPVDAGGGGDDPPGDDKGGGKGGKGSGKGGGHG